MHVVHVIGELVGCPWLPGQPPGWPCYTPAAPWPRPLAQGRTASLQAATAWPAGEGGLQMEPTGHGGPGRAAAVPSAASGEIWWRCGGTKGGPPHHTGCTPT